MYDYVAVTGADNNTNLLTYLRILKDDSGAGC